MQPLPFYDLLCTSLVSNNIFIALPGLLLLVVCFVGSNLKLFVEAAVV